MIRYTQETQRQSASWERGRVGQLGQGRFSVGDNTIKELEVLK